MARNFYEYESYNADIVPYSGYNSTKTVLGSDIQLFTGSTNYDYYIGPPTTAFRDITQDTGVNNWGDIASVKYSGDVYWLFALKGGGGTTVATTDICLYEFNSKTYSYTYVGAVACSNNDSGSNRAQNGLSANLSYYTGGTVEVSGTSVTGTNTNWLSSRIPIGARIGFGSSDPANISTWYRINAYPAMNSAPTLMVGSGVVCVTVDSSGKIYCGGGFTQYSGIPVNNIMRLNDNGTLDTSFPTSGFNGSVSVIKIDGSGKLYVGGSFTTYSGAANNNIIKLNSDGTKDTSFDNSTGFNNTVSAIEFDSTGKLWVGGSFTTYKGVANTSYLTKLNTDGSRDTSYPTTAATNPNTTVITIAVDPNDDVYIGGNFTQIGTTANNSRYIAKISKTGFTDPSFTVGAAGATNAFNSPVFKIIYRPETNTLIVGGQFTQWKGVGNTHLTEISTGGTALQISKSVNVNYSIVSANTSTFYSSNQNSLTKRDFVTMSADTIFYPSPTFILNSNTSDFMSLSPSGDTLYVGSTNVTVDSGIVAVETTGGTRDVNFATTPDYKTQRITLDSSAGTYSAGTPYVVEELILTMRRTGVGLYLIQGLVKTDFTVVPTAIVSPSNNFMGLSKGQYKLSDVPYNSTSTGYITSESRSPTLIDSFIVDRESDNVQYVYCKDQSGNLVVFNIRNSYSPNLGNNSSTILRLGTLSELIFPTASTITPTSVGTLTGFATGKLTIAQMQSGSASGVTSLYSDGTTGLIQTPINLLENTATGTTPVFTMMQEVPPGSTTTYNTAGITARVYYMPKIDRLISLNSGTAVKSFITGYRTNLQQPTLSSTFYSRTTYDDLAYNNSYDLAFLFNGQQLQGNTANVNAPRYPDTLGTGFYGAITDGVLHLCRPLNTIQNNLYAVPLGCEATYVDYSNNAFFSPKITLPNVIGVTGLYINQFKEFGVSGFSIPPEVIVVHYRTSGIDTNTGDWTEYTNVQELNDDIICEGVIQSIDIQFRFSYRIAGNTCIPNRIYGFALAYEDNRTDSHYSPSIGNSNLNNRIFAWRQDSLWNSNIPNLKIRLYNATNNNIVFYDTVTNSSSGTWEYSTDNGVTWLPWDNTQDAVGNYIRYVADFIPSGIKLRVGLNTI